MHTSQEYEYWNIYIIYVHFDIINIVAWTLPLSLVKYHTFGVKNTGRLNRKETCLVQLHFSIEKVQCFSTSNTPKNYGGTLCKMQRRLKKRTRPNDIVPFPVGYIPVPFVARFSIYSRLFNMQNSCQKMQYQMHQGN